MTTTNIVVTGANGFVGKHLVEALGRREGVAVFPVTRDSPTGDAEEALRSASFVFHLAGVNRPDDPRDFESGNREWTSMLCEKLNALRVPGSDLPVLVLSSSIQAAFDNPYGRSKLGAERAVGDWVKSGKGHAAIFRFKNMFGKWCRPHYNSVTATFCHQLARDLPIEISNEDQPIELIYIDDVIASLLSVLDSPPVGCEFREGPRSFELTLGELAAKIRGYRESRQNLRLADFSDDFNAFLYTTYLSYLEGDQFVYALDQKTDPRGSLAEFIKSDSSGQIFVSRTKPGVTRGNHYHHTKTEKFLVLEGQAVIRFRQILGSDVIEHTVDGRDYMVVDIPPGYTHSIENVGKGELVTLFWASEIFDPENPDTYFVEVLQDKA